jgi:hypothetical protein
MDASMRSRLLGLAIIATLLLNIWGAEIAFARSATLPACCVRAAHTSHCHGVDTQAADAEAVVVEAHFHSGAAFVADHPIRCSCHMGFAPANAAIAPQSGASLRVSESRTFTLPAIHDIASSTSTRIHGERAPPTA